MYICIFNRAVLLIKDQLLSRYATRYHHKAKIRSESAAAVTTGKSGRTGHDEWAVFEQITRIGGATLLDIVRLVLTKACVLRYRCQG